MIHLTLTAAVLYYTVWFLYTGMDTMAAPPCSRYAFLFAKVYLFHGSRIWFKIVFTPPTILASVSFLVYSLLFLLQPSEAKKQLSIAFRKAEEYHYWQSVLLSPFLTFVFIITTELELRFNHIRGVHTVNGTGQILPIVIGLGMLLAVLWKVWRS